MRKTKSQHGFTLIEMLIVVAIIAILIAVSIPMVNNALERSRVATDAANERSAKAEATIMFLDGELDKWLVTADSDVAMPYKAADGELVTPTGVPSSTTAASHMATTITANSIPAYGKCTTEHTNTSGGKAGAHSDKILWVRVDGSGEVQMYWFAASITTVATGTTWPGTVTSVNNIHGSNIADS